MLSTAHILEESQTDHLEQFRKLLCESVCLCVCVCECVCVMFFCCSSNSCGPAVSVLHFSLIACDQGDKVMGSIPAWGAVGSGGQVLPRPSVLRWAISWAFLCGACMLSPCAQGVSSTKNPNRKTCKKNRTLLSVPDRDGWFTWSPGAEKLPTAPGGSWRKDVPGWEKSRRQIHGDLRPVCVSCVASIYNTCVLQ